MKNHYVVHKQNEKGNKYAIFLEKNTAKIHKENQDDYFKEEIETTINFKE